MNENYTRSEVVFDPASREHRLEEIENLISRKGFWDHPEQNKSILKERTLLNTPLEKYRKFSAELEDARILLEMAEEESDTETVTDLEKQIKVMNEELDRFSIELMLDGEDDANNAIVSINAGAGGTEAQDWAEILLRMYTRWVEQHNFKLEMIDRLDGDEAGIKSATFTVGGEYAYGYLKTEVGVHRLVRISPFNANGKRHTSFASVFVYPELDNEIVIDIEDKDLRIDVFRASGAGGQHVNKTSSAVRITHLPTGIVVSCQQEKSQHRNKDMAMKVLKSRLYQREKRIQDEKFQEIPDGKDEIAWGSQIRSYVLHPYQMVKDHRLDLDIGNINSVLDGGIDPFIEGILLSKKQIG